MLPVDQDGVGCDSGCDGGEDDPGCVDGERDVEGGGDDEVGRI